MTGVYVDCPACKERIYEWTVIPPYRSEIKAEHFHSAHPNVANPAPYTYMVCPLCGSERLSEAFQKEEEGWLF